MEHTLVYRVWQAPFAERKFAPIRAHNDLTPFAGSSMWGVVPARIRITFAKADYLGIDINPAYIEAARRRTGRQFVAADATTFYRRSRRAIRFHLPQ